MDITFSQPTRDLLQATGGHIFYCFNHLERYIENAASYILSGIRQGDYVILIENERIYPAIVQKVKVQLTESQLDQLVHVNNFEFYWSYGDFHTPSIIANFSRMLHPYDVKEYSIRTWAHVEWGNEQEITQKICEFEVEANHSVQSMNLVSVCAYDGDRITEPLRDSLMKSHQCHMKDDGILPLDHPHIQ
ncbi:MEDS domain-containing protein [Mesobacillus foraminis]|uniref:MEDS domain-containing protein n=1 Tax=Mesobacillus foraminis TaxID=279826 RepID=UPI0039A02165